MSTHSISGLPLFNKGKVRDIYALEDKLLLVATDRISAFDVILPTEIPGKGKILTALSVYWFKVMEDIVPHHLITTNIDQFPAICQPYKDSLEGRSMLVKKSKPAPVECVVRGYLVGSGWKEYQKTGEVCGIRLPSGLVEASRLEEPIFTPSTKAPVGEHDLNITFDQMVDRITRPLAEKMRDFSLAIYRRARDMAEKKGILIADTKLEFGIENGEIILIDELLTPDSSRFWPADGYRPGKTPDSFDKQFVRDYLLNLPWDMKSPPPALPPEIVKKTQEKYAEALRRLTQVS
ncbi:MAG TPA: phosphoribosylaminoimidazolesuccinocarboxamide synthase [Candidatus Binatia bacterium]|nr:phosphoribosylaminoimidazolesuccinocarboxamide synthase [Candidatus Binatia bacterium]